MIQMGKLWIAGITQNQAQAIEQLLCPISPHFGKNCGAIFVDGGSADNTVKVLNSWCDIVLHRKWTNDHDFQMNVFLREGLIKHGDWVLIIDSSERINPDFLVKLKTKLIPNFETQNINMVYQRSKPLLFRYYDDQIFLGSPHWGLQNQRHHMVDISKFDGFQDDKSYVWSLRDDINKWITNGMKYYYVYGRSNHMWLVYNPANYPNSTQNLIQQHENLRHQFRDYCRNELKLNMTLLDLCNFITNEDLPEKFTDFMNKEKVIANYYRYMVLGHDQQEIYDTQNEWRFP
jgi:hypothetical protein